MSDRAPWIPRYLIGELKEGRWGLFDQSQSLLQPVQSFTTEQEARDALAQVGDEEIVDPTGVSDDEGDAWDASSSG